MRGPKNEDEARAGLRDLISQLGNRTACAVGSTFGELGEAVVVTMTVGIAIPHEGRKSMTALAVGGTAIDVSQDVVDDVPRAVYASTVVEILSAMIDGWGREAFDKALAKLPDTEAAAQALFESKQVPDALADVFAQSRAAETKDGVS